MKIISLLILILTFLLISTHYVSAKVLKNESESFNRGCRSRNEGVKADEKCDYVCCNRKCSTKTSAYGPKLSCD